MNDSNIHNIGPFLFNDVIKIFNDNNISYSPSKQIFNESNYTLIVDDNYECKFLVKIIYREKLIWNEFTIDKNGKKIFPFEILVKKHPNIKESIKRLKAFKFK